MLKSIIMKELKMIVREKGNFFFLIGMPILFIVLFGSIFGNANTSITVQYIDQDESVVSQDFLSQIDKISGFELVNSDSNEKDQIEQLRDGKISSLLVIPENFEKNMTSGSTPTTLQFYRDPTAIQVVAPIQAVLENITNRYGEHKVTEALKTLGLNSSEVDNILLPPLTIEVIDKSAKHTDAISQYVPGYTVMFVFFIMITMVRRFFQEKQSGMVARLRTTPLKPIVYLIGMWIPALISVLIQCTVLLGFGHLVYDLDLGNMGAISIIVLCLSICGTGLGLAMAVCVSGENQGLALTQVFALGGAVLAGLWFPFELLPSFAQTIGHFTPQYWAQTGLQDVMVRDAQVSDVWQGLLVLLGYGILGILIALVRFKYFIKAAIN
ncbi:ABC transporter permease [Paenisporosarcina antarctica]|uniref:ABC transporter permease n=2 Tax=Paenisporosarcina antarctica TaxID=417367 RepID=A0A4P7A219_9BACL|nr:ABC transporter permease [Paenisporosarcina antarctica]